MKHSRVISRHLSTLPFSFEQNILHASDLSIENYVRAIHTERAVPREDEEGAHAPPLSRFDQ
jgi:hypothetical protein